MGQPLHVVDDAAARGRESRHGLEVGVGQIGDAAVNQVGQGAEDRKDDPDGHHHHIGIAAAQ